MTLDAHNIAAIAHAANLAYCEEIGDISQVHWLNAPDWQRDSAITGVWFISDHPDTTPEELHASWLAEKAAAGWVYGEAKDPEKKTHPCCLPYGQLPEEQKAKDRLFGAVVRALLNLPAPG